jgi:hypothetical protein
MNWILIAITSGMLMTGHYDTEEACLGRKAMLEKDKITNIKCVDMRQNYMTTNVGSSICFNNTCTAR